MKRLFVIVFLTLAPCLFAKKPPKEPTIEYVTVSPMKPFPASNQKGGTAKIVLTVMKGFHIQANPASAPNLIATSLKLENPDGIAFGAIRYPLGKPYRLAGATNDIATFDGKAEISIPFEVNPNTPKGVITANGNLRFQACDDKTCFFPSTIPVSIPIEVR